MKLKWLEIENEKWKLKKNLENSRETRISLVTALWKGTKLWYPPFEATPCHCIACRTYLYSPYFTPGVRGEANSGWSQAINDWAESLAKYLANLFAISIIYFQLTLTWKTETTKILTLIFPQSSLDYCHRVRLQSFPSLSCVSQLPIYCKFTII